MTANLKRLTFVARVAHAHNMGLNEMAGEVLNQTMVFSTNICAWLKVGCF